MECRLVCVDFDSTFLGIHTNGEWSKTAKELIQYVRPLFLHLIPLLALHSHISIAVVTFSSQVKLIQDVLSLIYDSKVSDAIIIRGDEDSWSITDQEAVEFTGIDAYHLSLNRRSKFPYVASAALEASHRQSKLSTVMKRIQSCHTVLIDDCQDNIYLATQCGITAIHYEPHKFPQHIQNELKRRKRKKDDVAVPYYSSRFLLQSPPSRPILHRTNPMDVKTPLKDSLPRYHLCTPSPVTKLKISNSIGKPKAKRYTKLRMMSEKKEMEENGTTIATTLAWH